MSKSSYHTRLKAAQLEHQRTRKALINCPEWKANHRAEVELGRLDGQARRGFAEYMKQYKED